MNSLPPESDRQPSPEDLERCDRALRASLRDEPPAGAVGRAVEAFRARNAAAASSSPIAWVKAMIAAVVADTRQGLAVAGWRSEATASDDVHLAFEAEDLRVDLVATPIDEGTRWRVRGQLASAGSEPTEVAVVRAHEPDADPLVRTLPDDAGFRFEVDAGVYLVWIELDDGSGAVSLRLALDAPPTGPQAGHRAGSGGPTR
jgi:hypothetical protein